MDKVLCLLLLLLGICYPVSSQETCISIYHNPTRNMIEGQPEYRCEVSNGCEDTEVCGIVLKCPGFEPIVPVDTKLLAKGKVDKCLIYQGYPIGGPGHVAFTYALPSGGIYDFRYDGANNCTFHWPPPNSSFRP